MQAVKKQKQKNKEVEIEMTGGSESVFVCCVVTESPSTVFKVIRIGPLFQ